MNKNLVCPYCGDMFEAVLEYSGGSFSEHRDHMGYVCDNWKCNAEWDRQGIYISGGLAVTDD